MKLEFSYSLEKDVENFKVTSQSINNKQPTKLHALYISKYCEVFEDQKIERFITDYIKQNRIDMSLETERIQSNWRSIEQDFLKRSSSLFHLTDTDGVIHVYLTMNGRCSYNTEQRYFFVSVSRRQIPTIMHELFHFWTWEAFREEVENGRMTQDVYNDVKESLTELLNIEFSDLLNGEHDDGYPQHKEIRLVVAKTWNETRDIHKTFEAAVKSCLVDTVDSQL